MYDGYVFNEYSSSSKQIERERERIFNKTNSEFTYLL